MNKFWLLMGLVITSCNMSRQKVFYKDSSQEYLVEINESDNNGKVDTLNTLFLKEAPEKIAAVGFIKDGFRNDYWNYNLPSGVLTLRWAHYLDNKLNFETNVLEKIDTLKRGEFYTKFLFVEKGESLVLTVAINSNLKDSLPDNNYERIIKNEFALVGLSTLEFRTQRLLQGTKNIHVSEIVTQDSESNDKYYIKTAFAFLSDGQFVDFSVSSSEKSSVIRDILFDAVFTSLKVNGAWFYDPFGESSRD